MIRSIVIGDKAEDLRLHESTVGGLDTKCSSSLFKVFELILYDI